MSPTGELVWDWKSQDHFSLAETGHRWPWAINHGYDIEHWNSIEREEKSVIASFRHLDAVDKIRKSTGDIVRRFGGIKTPERLTVTGEPRGHPLGAPYDVRLVPDGTLTVFDNATNLSNYKPRVVRYRITTPPGPPCCCGRSPTRRRRARTAAARLGAWGVVTGLSTGASGLRSPATLLAERGPFL